MDKKIRKHQTIVASLDYGVVFSRFLIWFIYLGIILCVLCFVFMLFIIVTDRDYQLLILLPFLFVSMAGFIYIICFNIKQKSHVKPFLDDVIELSAKTIVLDRSWTMGLVKIPISKIAVTFTFEGKEMVRQSGRKDLEKSNAKNYKTGYNAIFNKYANRQIQILYSPKYDQVLILKDKKQKNKK